jgi:hypothetical protein
LTNNWGKCYDKGAQFSHCWANKKFTINRQGFGYITKKGKAAFVQTKTTFVKNSAIPFCESCRNAGDYEKNCTNKRAISFDPRYVLIKNSSGSVCANLLG